jgi:ectoine hydroxylase-related dioxygenase (phytanoyl-CoA dioxygenase family)
MWKPGELNTETYLQHGYLVIRQLIERVAAETMYQEYLRAVRGEIAVPTWREYLTAKRKDTSAIAPDPRGEGLFMQSAHPSDAPDLSHWKAHPCYERATVLARLLCPAEGIFLAYDQCFYKPPGSEAIVYPHQDAAYWRVQGITCWVALTPVTRDTAPVQYYPQSHHRLLPHVDAPKAWNGVRDHAVAPDALGASAAEPVVFELEPGDCVFHSALTVHGSGPNLGPSARCGLALHYKTTVPVT